MIDRRALIAPALAAAGIACFAAAWLLARPAHGNTTPEPRWIVVYSDGTPWRTPRGNTAGGQSETACSLAMVEAVRDVPSGTRLKCKREK